MTFFPLTREIIKYSSGKNKLEEDEEPRLTLSSSFATIHVTSIILHVVPMCLFHPHQVVASHRHHPIPTDGIQSIPQFQFE